MMRFGEGRRHQAIADAIRISLAAHDIAALRADDKAYAEYLMANVRTYMHGCGLGIAVFERIESETHNPNVALEVGYMLALGKPVCLLKDKTLKQLPTDMVGSLYSEFDLDTVTPSIQSALDRWLRQRGLAKE
jgi:nucleoside 2-deoxyribosyltransferase